MNPAIVVEQLSKKYSKMANAHLAYGVSDLWAEVFGRTRTLKLRPDEFLAVDDVSFFIEPGTSFALVGRNGSGKTTVLKLLTGLIKPDAGKVLVEGRVQALIALGAGFNPSLSGRENVYNAAALLGLGRKQTTNILDEIVDFAEIEEFIDSPVQTYSSGMHARLGFAVAVHLKPDILLIDEILSVGDFAFQNKCFARLFQLKMNGVTIVLVSHSHTRVTQLCDQALWMHKGKSMQLGPAKDVVKAYLAYLDAQEAKNIEVLNRLKKENAEQVKQKPRETLYGPIYDGEGQVSDVELTLLVGTQPVDAVRVHDELLIRYSFRLLRPVRDLNITLNFYREDGLHLTTISTLNGDLVKNLRSDLVNCEVVINDFNFNPGKYIVVMPIHEGHSYLYRDIVKKFVVTGSDALTWGIADLKYEYRVDGNPVE